MSRLLSVIFPPKLLPFDLEELRDSLAYKRRITRNGIEGQLGQNVRVIEPLVFCPATKRLLKHLANYR